MLLAYPRRPEHADAGNGETVMPGPSARSRLCRGVTVWGLVSLGEGSYMSGLISWICRAGHRDQDGATYLPNLTIHEGRWAYCPQGGSRQHSWDPIDPAPLELLRVRHASGVFALEESATNDRTNG